jgi:NTP pyrophosphatase (non-canonical NTP hydrolase)
VEVVENVNGTHRGEIFFAPKRISSEDDMPMDLSQLTKKMHHFVEGKGWYGPESPRPQTGRNLAISLLIEAAEVLEHFQWGEALTNKDALASELADVALYLLQLASVNDIDLERAILKKLEENVDREW